MTRPAFFDALFPNGAPLYYQGTFKDKPFTKQWTTLDRADDSGYELSFYLELDPRPLGQGGAVLKERTRLLLDKKLRPVGYGSEAQGVKISLKVDGTKATAFLPDRTKVDVEFGDARFIVESNITGLDALLFAIAHSNGELDHEVQLKSFLLNQLMVIPYTVTPLGDRTYKSSYDEELHIDEQGVLQSTHVTKASVVFTRLPAPPVPFWHGLPDGTRALDLLKYNPPPQRTFEIQDVSIASRRGEVGGTLTIPKGSGPFPAVLFLSGTGTHDRHGIAGNLDIGSHEIVDYLSEHGHVGLRFDTRGAGTTKSGEDALNSSLEPLIDHASAWFSYLANRPEVDPKRITIVGHSQGGTVALLVSVGEGLEPAAVVFLATPGRPLHVILEEQIEHQARELGISDGQREKQVAEFRELIESVQAGKSFKAGSVPDYLVPSARRVAWFKDHLDIDPTELLRRLHCRVLICQGAKDFQISTLDSARLYEGAKAAGLDAKLEVFEQLDHLFKPCPHKSTLELYYDPTRRVDPDFLVVLRDWLVR